MVGYKLLRRDLTSISDKYGRIQYGPNQIVVPGHGAYLGVTVPGLLRGGWGSEPGPRVLAECEGQDPTGVVQDRDVVTVRLVRVLRHVEIDVWTLVRFAIWAG